MSRWTSLLLTALCLLSLGCNGSGNSSSGQTTVNISPAAVLVSLNGTQQFAASISGGSGVAIAASNGAVRASNIVTITTTSGHGFSSGTSVTISGVTDVTFIGTFIIVSVPTSTTFTYAQSGTDATSGSGTAASNAINWSVNDVQGGNAQFGTITTTGFYTAPSALPPSTTATITATGAVRRTNVVTITTTAAHNLAPGQVVNITGVTDTTFNGTFVVTGVPTTTTFTYSQSAADVSSGNGTVVSTAIRVKATSATTSTASATALVSIDSGITISVSPALATVATSDTFQFTATVTGPVSNTNVTWAVNDVQGGNATVGTIDANGLYTAPAAVPTTPLATIKATSVADTSRTAIATVTIATAAAPTLTAVTPTTVAQGSIFQDIYLTGTNFLSTSTVRANGIAVPAVVVTNLLIRARLSTAQLATAGTLAIDILPQNFPATALFNVNVVPVRPALVGPSPDSVTQGSGTVSVNFNGGYYSPSVASEFNGGVRANTITSSRQLSVTLSAADLATPGLFAVTARNASATPSLAGANLAVQPTAGPTVAATVAVGAAPSAVAINPATGMAVVANRAANTISVISLATNSVTATIPVGTAPTGVAVDHLRNLAYVANNGSNNVSVVDLGSNTVVATITGFNIAPVSVGVNPATRQGLVALTSTTGANVAALIDTNTNQIVSAANISNGLNPRVAIEPRLNWAIVTPGGAGVLSIVDLGKRTTGAITASGAVRSGNSVTITTAASHNLAVGQSVFIGGVTDPSFTGFFTVASAPTATTFTYGQSAPNATSGGGSFTLTSPLATANLGISLRGVSYNEESSFTFLCDPTTPNAVIFSLFDQTVTNVGLEAGAEATAVNPLTNIGVIANPATDEASVIDLRSATRLARLSVGTDPRAVALDAATNVAVIANEGSNNVTILNLGAIRPLHVLEVTPSSTFSSASPVTITVTGGGFTASSVVRLDEAALATSFVSSRVLTAVVPAGSLGAARRFAVDVLEGGARSNIEGFTVIGTVAVGTTPGGVAIDQQRNIALVTNTASNNVSVIDLATNTVTATITVGTNPQAVAVLPRAGRAVVTNRGSNTASVIDLATNTVLFPVTVGTEPVGVAINPDSGFALVANASSNTVSTFPAEATSAPNAGTFTVNPQPLAIAIDYTRNQALIAHGAANNAIIVDLTSTTPTALTTVSNIPLASGAVYDPASDRYLVSASLANNLTIITPGLAVPQLLRTGINPTSLAYNMNAATLVTVNTASQTMTVVDFLDRRVRAVLPLTAGSLFAIAIHPVTNVAVIADAANNRVLLYPLPR